MSHDPLAEIAAACKAKQNSIVEIWIHFSLAWVVLVTEYIQWNILSYF